MDGESISRWQDHTRKPLVEWVTPRNRQPNNRSASSLNPPIPDSTRLLLPEIAGETGKTPSAGLRTRVTQRFVRCLRESR